jgi:hypothetical protein
MSLPISNQLFFSCTSLAALIMIGEGFTILRAKKQITPIPSRILFWLGILVFGREKSTHQLLGRASLHELHSYALYVVILGISC